MTDAPRIRPLTERDIEEFSPIWRDGQSLERLLPLHVGGDGSDEGYDVEEIEGECAACGQVIDPRMVRVRVIRHESGMVECRAVGACCKTATAFWWRFRPEGRFESLVRGEWRTYRLTGDSLPWWDLLGRLSKLLGGLGRP